MSALSDSADQLLRLRLSGQRVEVTDETRTAYQELAAGGLAESVPTCTKAGESHYRLTQAAMARKVEFLSHSIRSPSREESAA
jgi:hypothetical protein